MDERVDQRLDGWADSDSQRFMALTHAHRVTAGGARLGTSQSRENKLTWFLWTRV